MRFKPILFLLIAILLYTACKKEENFTSRINFVHGALGYPAITLKADSTLVFSNLPYDTFFLNRVTPSGTRSISLFTANGVASPPFTTNLESGGATYTGVLYDTAGSTKFYIRKDVLPATPAEGRCQVRIYNMIKGSENLVLANKINVPKDSFRYYLSAGSFANFASSNTFTEIDTFPAPSIRVDTLHPVTTLPPFRSGKIYSIFLMGRINDTITGLYKPKAIIQVHN